MINVAPPTPTPARPVEKAKKVAVQKSGSGIGDEKKGVDARTDALDARTEPMTRLTTPTPSPATAVPEPTPSFTPLSHRDQPSAWARDLQWGGGLTLAALIFAFGFVTVRPTPRRRLPEVPAPATARNYQRRR